MLPNFKTYYKVTVVSTVCYHAMLRRSVMSTLCDPLDGNPPGSSVYGHSPDKNSGVDCHALFEGIFPTQGSNPGLLHCKQILYHLSHQGSPNELEWVAYPFSRGSFQPRNWTRASCIEGRFFTYWATKEAPIQYNIGRIDRWTEQNRESDTDSINIVNLSLTK